MQPLSQLTPGTGMVVMQQNRRRAPSHRGKLGRRLVGAGGLIALGLIGLSGAGAQEATPSGFAGYPGASPFTVVPRRDDLEFYPCTGCHEFMEPDPTVRELFAPHEIELNHGQGRIWCLTCHAPEGRDHLISPLGESIDFDAAHLVCGGCHSNRHKDWYFGAHGKRVGNWQGERQLYNCTHCHDPHDPSIKPREPKAAPKVRAGLVRAPHAPSGPVMPWDRRATATSEGEQNDEH